MTVVSVLFPSERPTLFGHTWYFPGEERVLELLRRWREDAYRSNDWLRAAQLAQFTIRYYERINGRMLSVAKERETANHE